MRKENLVILLILLLALLLRLVNLNQSFWLDEAAQVYESNVAFIELFDQPIVPHPPLYRLLMHFWLPLSGKQDWILRIPSVLLGIGSIIVVYKLSFEIASQFSLPKTKWKLLAVFSALLLATSQYHIYYSQEFRPYALSCFLGVLSTYFLLSKRWWLYTISSILFLYTTYFAPFLFIAHIGIEWFFHRIIRRSFLISLALVGISFTPYFPFFLKQIQMLAVGMVNDVPGWSEAVSIPSLKVLPLTFVKFTLGRLSFHNKYFYAALASFTLLLYLIAYLKAYKTYKRVSILLIILILVPLFIAFVISPIAPVIAPQRLIFTLPFVVLLFTIGLISFSRKIAVVLFVAVSTVQFVSVWLYYTNPLYQREQWKEAVNYVEMQADEKSVAMFVFPRPFAPWQYYEAGKVQSIGVTEKLVVTDNDLNKLSFQLPHWEKIYLFQYLTGLSDPGEQTRKVLNSNGYVEKDIKNFDGVGFIYVYDKRQVSL